MGLLNSFMKDLMMKLKKYVLIQKEKPKIRVNEKANNQDH